jgi:hypothetical protein
MEGEDKPVYYNEELRCYRNGTIERKSAGWKEWRKSEGRVIKINKLNHSRARIIAKTFLSVPEDDKFQVRQRNGDADDCRVENIMVILPEKIVKSKEPKNWEGIKCYNVMGEEGKTQKKYRVMCNGTDGGEFILYSSAKYVYDTMLGKKWVWRIINQEHIPNREHYLERGRADTKEEAEILGKYEMLKLHQRQMWGKEFQDLWILDIYSTD